jgi:outer membrane protein OmpA-like peptidoglycan-associated protein
VTADGSKSTLSHATPRSQQAVDKAYEALIKAQPTKPKTFILHFQLDSVVLTEASKSLVGEMLRVAKERKPTEITVYGHADASGSDERNNKLSAERARVVADLLRKSDPSLDNIQVQYFGDREPLVPTDGRSPEPRNRRAEVVIL